MEEEGEREESLKKAQNQTPHPPKSTTNPEHLFTTSGFSTKSSLLNHKDSQLTQHPSERRPE